MGFGFNLFFAFVLVPISGILFLIWFFTGKKVFGRAPAYIWVGVVGVILLSVAISVFTIKKEVDRDDLYGQYVIDRNKFSGKQADWRYNHFRFEITPQNKLLFHITNEEKIVKTIKGEVMFSGAYNRPRIVLKLDTPGHHVLNENPTLYRTVWDFYYVFNSPKFGNIFFRKGEWRPIAR